MGEGSQRDIRMHNFMGILTHAWRVGTQHGICRCVLFSLVESYVAAASGLSHTLSRLIDLFVVTMQMLTASSLRKCKGAACCCFF
jgi:hypothetical protein